MKKSKNLKGFTLVEEVVSLFILSILILVASGMMISAMRVYSVNVKTQSAQNKGQYVYDLLSNKLTYSSGLQYETNGVFEPTNATYYEDREVKGVFDESEIYQEIAVDKNGITKGFKGETATERVEFAPYDVEVLLEAETAATSESVAPSASASADNSMNDEALFNLVSNSEVTDSAGYLTPQGEVSFLGGLEIMNQSAEMRTLSNIGDNLNYRRENDYYLIDNIPNDVSCVEITVENKKPTEWLGMYYYVSSEQYNQKTAFNEPVTEKTFYISLNSDNWIKLMQADKYYIKSVKVKSLSSALPLKVNVSGKEYTNGQTTEKVKIKMGESFQFSANKGAFVASSTGNGYIDVKGNDGKFTITAKKYQQNQNNNYTFVIMSGKQSVTISVEVLPFPLSVTIDNIKYTYNNIPNNTIDVNMYTNETKNINFNTEKVNVECRGGNITADSKSIKSHENTGGYDVYCYYGGASFKIRVNVTKPEDPFNIIPTEVKYLVVNDNDTSNTANKGFQIQTNKTENGSLTENAKKTYDKIEYYFVDKDGNKIESDLAEISETGYVIAKKAGTVKICATAIRKDGKADEVSTNKVTISVSEPISVSPSEITVFAGDEFTSLPFKVETPNNYKPVDPIPWGITFNNNGMQVNKDFNDNSTVTITFKDTANNSTATLTVNIVKFKILNLTDTNINLQKGKSLQFESNYDRDDISRGTKTFSIEIADQTLISIDENGTNNDITKTIKATSDKIGGSNVIVKFGSENIQYYYINVVEKEKTLKIDDSNADTQQIILWAGETHTFQLSSTLEEFNDVYVENSDSSVLSYAPTKNGDGTYTLDVIAGKPDRDTVVTLTVYDRCYLVNDDKSVTDEKGVPIRITITIKVPTVDTNSITVYKGGDSVRINTYDTPLDKLTWDITSTDILVEMKSDGVNVTGINKTSSPVTLKLTYNFNDVTYEFEIRVTVNEKSEAPSESPSEAPPANSSAVSSSKTTTGTTCTGEPISKYRFRLTVTVKDKKGREIYERSGSVSVMNYDVNRYPTLSEINFNNDGNGFKLRIYYVD